MAKWNISDAEIDRQLAEAEAASREAEKTEPRAETAYYDSMNKNIVVGLTTGASFSFPYYMGQGLDGASAKELSKVEITPLGDGLRWRNLDVSLDLPALMLGIFGNQTWMAKLGKIGGQSTSKAKAAAARINGMKGGRPPKTQPASSYPTQRSAVDAAKQVIASEKWFNATRSAAKISKGGSGTKSAGAAGRASKKK